MIVTQCNTLFSKRSNQLRPVFHDKKIFVQSFTKFLKKLRMSQSWSVQRYNPHQPALACVSGCFPCSWVKMITRVHASQTKKLEIQSVRHNFPNLSLLLLRLDRVLKSALASSLRKSVQYSNGSTTIFPTQYKTHKVP